MHADERKGARYINVNVLDEVLMRQGRMNKFSTTFNGATYSEFNDALSKMNCFRCVLKISYIQPNIN